MAVACGETKKAGSYTITGEIKSVPEGLVRLSTYDGDTRTSTVIDSSSITNGQFTLKGNMKTAEMVSLSIGEGDYGLSFFLENVDIIIKANRPIRSGSNSIHSLT